MGCGSSRQVKAGVVDVYRPAPSSFAVFDINSIEEPWLKLDHRGPPPLDDQEKQTQPKTQPTRATVPATVLEKLEATAETPRSWDEVSKVLETHLKPTAAAAAAAAAVASTKPADPPVDVSKPPAAPPPRKSFSFHTVEELEAKTKANNTGKGDIQKPVQLRNTESTRTQSFSRTESPTESLPSLSAAAGFRPVKENIFVVRDRLEREKEGNKRPAVNWDPLREFPEKCPPGGADAVVVYTTSLRGIRRTYEDCARVRAILEQQGVVFDERDVALDGGVLKELKELMGGAEGPPRVFIKGRYVGGVEEVAAMNETGRLGRLLRWARVERVREEGRHTCEGCGGVRWLPCLECGGSCKVRPLPPVAGEGWETCGKCNENGLVRCPVCSLSGKT